MASDASWVCGPCPTPVQVTAYGHTRLARCLKRSCAACGTQWLGDTRVKVLAAAQELTAAVGLITVTGPGQDVLPWDESGKRVIGSHAAAWNATAPERWSALHQAARERVARDHLSGCPQVHLLIKVWEYQKRGILHLHLVVPMGTGHQARAAEAYAAALSDMAPRYGFGFVDRGKLPQKGQRQSARTMVPVAPWRAAAYVAGYVVSSGAGKPGVAEVATKQGVPGAVVYVSRRLTDASRVTMRTLRARRRIVALFPGCDQSPQKWRAATVVDGLSRRRAPLTPECRATLYRAALEQQWTDVIDQSTGRWTSPTPAASPRPVSEAVRAQPAVRSTGRVRLDLVLHDRHDPHSGTRFWTGVSEVLVRSGRA